MADEMNTERDMPEGITRDDTAHGETYYTAADMATASAQGFRDGVASLSAAEPAPALTQVAAIAAGSPVVKESLTTDIAAGAVYAELPDDVIDYVKGSYAFLQSTAPDGYAEEVFRLPPSATLNQRSLQDALQSDKRGWHPAAARQDSGDGKRSGPDAGVSASHGQAPAHVELYPVPIPEDYGGTPMPGCGLEGALPKLEWVAGTLLAIKDKLSRGEAIDRDWDSQAFTMASAVIFVSRQIATLDTPSPQAAQQAATKWDGKLPDSLQRCLNALRLECPPAVVNGVEHEARSTFEALHTTLATTKRMYGAARDRMEAMEAAQQAPTEAKSSEVQIAEALRAKGLTLVKTATEYEVLGLGEVMAQQAPAGATEMENLQRTAVGWQERALRAERNWAVCRRWAIAGGAPVEKLGDDPDQPFHAASPTIEGESNV